MKRFRKSKIVAFLSVFVLLFGILGGFGGPMTVRAGVDDRIIIENINDAKLAAYDINGDQVADVQVQFKTTDGLWDGTQLITADMSKDTVLAVLNAAIDNVTGFDSSTMEFVLESRGDNFTAHLGYSNDTKTFSYDGDGIATSGEKHLSVKPKNAGGPGPAGDTTAHVEFSSSPHTWVGKTCVREGYYNYIDDEDTVSWDYVEMKSWRFCGVSVNHSNYSRFDDNPENNYLDVAYNKVGDDSTVSVSFTMRWSMRPDEIIRINNVEYRVSDYLDFGDETKWLDAFAFEYHNQDISFTIDGVPVVKDTFGNTELNIVLDLRPITEEECYIGNFLWGSNADIVNPESDLYTAHSQVELISATYPARLGGATFGEDVLKADSRVTKAEKAAKYVTYGIDENTGIGEMVLPIGSVVTMRVSPEFGYQVEAFNINGRPLSQDQFGASDKNIAYYTFTIGSANFHLGADVEETANEVESENSKAVSGGSVTLGGNESSMTSGTAKLEVEDIEPTDAQVSAFENAAGDYTITDYVDISLFNTIYKGSKENGSWDTPVSSLDNPATITLGLGDDISGKSFVIIHEKADGEYETIPAFFDEASKTITFETDSFSNYAIAGSDKKFIPENSGENGPEGYTLIYRLYNPNSGEHFFTESITEGNFLVNVGWNFEGNAWWVPKTGDPVYRLYNENAGDHHYTMSFDEKELLVSLGWKDEGIAWYSESAETGSPVYRLYNPNAYDSGASGAHHYTMSSFERDSVAEAGWIYEGISWYAK